MKDLLTVVFVIVLLTGCASAPLTSGYAQGVLDSGALTIKPTDSPATAKAKKLGQKIAESANKEIAELQKQVAAQIAAANKRAEAAEKRAENTGKQLSFWVFWGRVGMTESALLTMFIITAIILSRIKGRPISKAEAISRGYKACKVCDP